MRQRTTRRFRTTLITLVAATMLAAGTPASAYEDDRPRDDRYVFATTRGLNEMDAHPAFKIPVWPAAFAIDVLLLPFAALADAMNP
jgi:hypothetical protein